MSAEEVANRSRQICKYLMNLPQIQAAPQILVYAAVRGEVDLLPLVRMLWDCGKTVAFPRVCGEEMAFYRVDAETELTLGSYGIPEPTGGEPLIPSSGAVICVPGVAFSIHFMNRKVELQQICADSQNVTETSFEHDIMKTGHYAESDSAMSFITKIDRIGMGGGYYDRYLSAFPGLLRIGVAYDWQTHESWEPDACDVPMNILVTEEEIIHPVS